MDNIMLVLIVLAFGAMVWLFLTKPQPESATLRADPGAETHWGMRPGLCTNMDKSKWLEYSQKWVLSAYQPPHAECWYKYCARKGTAVNNDVCGVPNAQFTGCFEHDQSSGAETVLSTQPGCMSAAPFA